MAPRAISLWSHTRPPRNGIRKVVKYSEPTNSTSASCAWEAGLPRISTGRRQPLWGGVALVETLAERTPGMAAILSRSSVKKRTRSAQVVCAIFADGNYDRHHVPRFIAERHRVHANKSLNGRAGGGHQQQSQGDLARNQGGVQASAFHAARQPLRARPA